MAIHPDGLDQRVAGIPRVDDQASLPKSALGHRPPAQTQTHRHTQAHTRLHSTPLEWEQDTQKRAPTAKIETVRRAPFLYDNRPWEPSRDCRHFNPWQAATGAAGVSPRRLLITAGAVGLAAAAR